MPHPATDARQTYEQRHRELKALLDLCRRQLDLHARRARSEGLNWAHAGDLAHLRASLKEVLAFAMGGDVEGAAGELIEQAVARAMAQTKPTR